MSNYWKTREGIQKDRLYKKSEKEIKAKLAVMYEQAMKDIEKDMTDTFLTIIADGDTVLANELYKYNRYYNLRQSIKSRLNELGFDCLEELSAAMEGMYKYTSSITLDTLGYGRAENLEEVLQSLWESKGQHWNSTVWCKDGMTATKRLEANMAKLQTTLEKGLRDCVARGSSKDVLVKTLQERFSVSYSEANRLARTELMYVQNQATLNSYERAGVEQYEYMAYIDNRTSEMCADMNGQRFNIVDALVGENYPPLHPNCRCSTKAVINI